MMRFNKDTGLLPKFLIFTIVILLFTANLAFTAENNEDVFDDAYEETEEVTIADPLEPLNRLVFAFNDRLYFLVLKPVAKGYSAVFPEDIRMAIRNFFHNITTPVRVVNNLLQGKIKNAGIELARFCLNSTGGVFGLADFAGKELGLKVPDEDLGQTLGRYGIGHGIYIVWPVLGPSSLRDSIGLAGDLFLDPINYLEFQRSLTVQSYRFVNNTSLHIGDYEDLKAAALDPYIALQDAYIQYRKKETEK